MSEIKVILFQLGGVLLQSIECIVSKTLQKSVSVKDDIRKLIYGHIKTSDFCKRVIQNSRSEISIDTLENTIKSNIVLHDDVLDIVKDVSVNHDVFFIYNYPKEWLQQIEDRLGLMRYFKQDHIIYLEDCSKISNFHDLLHSILYRNHLPLSQCLLVDGCHEHTSEAIRLGLQAIIFMDSYRLRRELELRKILPSNSI